MSSEGAGDRLGTERKCVSCLRSLPPDSHFCPYCGAAQGDSVAPPAYPAPPYPYYHPRSPYDNLTIRDVGRGIGTWSSFILFLLMCVNLAILIWGISEVYPHADSKVWLYVITPLVVNLAELGGPLFLGWFIFLVVAIVASFVWMVKKSVPLLGEELLFRSTRGRRSPIYLISTLFVAIFFFSVAWYAILGLLGVPTTTPVFETRELWRLIYGFAHAAVWEEIVSRVLLIGIPLLIVGLVTRRQRKWYNYLLGGGFSLGPTEVFFLIFSSAMFGFAHLQSWDLFKVLPAAIAGLAMGYLFLREGLYASIMIHFFFDYLSMPLELDPSVSVVLIMFFLILAWLAIGAVYFVYYSAKAVSFFLGKEIWPARPMRRKAQPAYSISQYAAPPGQSPPASPPPQNRPQNPTAFGFTCKNCGHTEAVYKDGALYCLRCGAKN